MESNPQTNAKIACRVSLCNIGGNALLAIFKLTAGILAHSSAMISDAIHSTSDILFSLTVMIGAKMAAKQPDPEHEYGHERLECIAAVLLSLVLAVTGCGIGFSGVIKMIRASYGDLTVPGMLALIAAACSILCKELMYRYTRYAARKTGSSALNADAWHHRSDSFSSIGSLLGIWGARMGFPVLDPVASLVICLFILKVSLDIFRQSVSELTDRSCPPYVEAEMRELVAAQAGVERLDVLHTRQFGSRVCVDVEVEADSALPLSRAHAIAHQIYTAIRTDFPRVKHCMVHINPSGPSESEAPIQQ